MGRLTSNKPPDVGANPCHHPDAGNVSNGLLTTAHLGQFKISASNFIHNDYY